MRPVARPSFALAAVLAPLLALAQPAGGVDPAGQAQPGFGWLWIIAAVAIVVALLRVIFAGRRRGGPTPPARRP